MNQELIWSPRNAAHSRVKKPVVNHKELQGDKRGISLLVLTRVDGYLMTTPSWALLPDQGDI